MALNMALRARWWCSLTDLRCLILATLLRCSVGLLDQRVTFLSLFSSARIVAKYIAI
ncbi:hypothetical protein P154DRAFT_521194 [Amniculicola lignicola CBS 123094]|uniref:Uncharacterized protein n=1 Tax=Amniculicola lignicola CBS 123094 TaxID=1392246 RepID=A0A6A5WKM7_9PLEO|nr:hypothetical protein P154DRAFT_521194 [Amniculicola lignicola CBS 123094]